MNTRVRHAHIDFIKAVATIIVMITHVLAYHLSEYPTWFLWNYSHFVVVGLVFSSAYIFARANPEGTNQLSVRFFIKRFSRLYIPYLIYLIAHALLMNLIPEYFMGYGWKKTVPFFIQNVTLTGGVDFGWLPLLFIQLAILSPFLLRIARNKKFLIAYGVCIGLFITITVFLRIPTHYSRVIAWLPWSSIAMLGFLYNDIESRNAKVAKRITIYTLLIASGIYSMVHSALIFFNHPYSFDMHKYPPDISYLSYGVAWTALMLRIRSGFSTRIIVFISKHSYQIFFIHFILLDLVMTKYRSHWVQESAFIVFGTLGISYILSRLHKPHRS